MKAVFLVNGVALVQQQGLCNLCACCVVRWFVKWCYSTAEGNVNFKMFADATLNVECITSINKLCQEVMVPSWSGIAQSA